MYNINKLKSGELITMQFKTNLLLLITISLAFFGVFSAIGQAEAETTPTVTEVDSKYVCMVTNKLFPDVQIPVEVANKTYYGCCEMCKGQLANNPEKRMSTDPVSGKSIDKSDAVIGATANGNIYYFENKANLDSFSKN